MFPFVFVLERFKNSQGGNNGAADARVALVSLDDFLVEVVMVYSDGFPQMSKTRWPLCRVENIVATQNGARDV